MWPCRRGSDEHPMDGLRENVLMNKYFKSPAHANQTILGLPVNDFDP
jgi:hypothetical protein